MTLIFANIIAAILYASLGAYLAYGVFMQRNSNTTLVSICIGITLLVHAIGIAAISIKPDGIQLSFFSVSSQIFWTINTIVLFSSFKKALHNLFIFLLPASSIALLSAYFSHSDSSILQLDFKLATHVILSILSYSLLTIATLQAMLLAYQNYQLKSKHGLHRLRYLPPLQTMEALLFELLLVGEILLTLSLISGALIFKNIFAQHLIHKTVFSIAAWSVYALLLWGKYKLGIRGITAIRWTLAGFIFLMLAYFGSKLVLEIILHRV